MSISDKAERTRHMGWHTLTSVVAGLGMLYSVSANIKVHRLEEELSMLRREALTREYQTVELYRGQGWPDHVYLGRTISSPDQLEEEKGTQTD